MGDIERQNKRELAVLAALDREDGQEAAGRDGGKAMTEHNQPGGVGEKAEYLT